MVGSATATYSRGHAFSTRLVQVPLAVNDEQVAVLVPYTQVTSIQLSITDDVCRFFGGLPAALRQVGRVLRISLTSSVGSVPRLSSYVLLPDYIFQGEG